MESIIKSFKPNRFSRSLSVILCLALIFCPLISSAHAAKGVFVGGTSHRGIRAYGKERWRVLHINMELPGTGFKLNYASSRININESAPTITVGHLADGWSLSIFHSRKLNSPGVLRKGDGGVFKNPYADTFTYEFLENYKVHNFTWSSVPDGQLRHINTYDLNTQSPPRYTFGYDDSQQLTSVTDKFGNRTVIQRTPFGGPHHPETIITITSPYGTVTTLSVNAANQITSITYPDGSVYRFGYGHINGRFLTRKIDPLGNWVNYAYDDAGFLASMTDAAGTKTYSRSESSGLWFWNQRTSGESEITSYSDTPLNPDESYTTTRTASDGTVDIIDFEKYGYPTQKVVPGRTITYQWAKHPEFNFPVQRQKTVRIESGLTKNRLKEVTYNYTHPWGPFGGGNPAKHHQYRDY